VLQNQFTYLKVDKILLPSSSSSWRVQARPITIKEEISCERPETLFMKTRCYLDYLVKGIFNYALCAGLDEPWDKNPAPPLNPTTVFNGCPVDLYRCATVGALSWKQADNTLKPLFRDIHLDPPPSFRP
jgi:hypothetical protein